MSTRRKFIKGAAAIPAAAAISAPAIAPVSYTHLTLPTIYSV